MANPRCAWRSKKPLNGQGHSAAIISGRKDVQKADRLVVPGVGAFRDAIKVMRDSGMGAAIKDFVATGRPMLGICLGLQLLMDKGYEDGEHDGLGVIAGDCVRFAVDAPPLSLKVPHMGWNALAWERNVPIFKGLTQGAYVYFVHSYYVKPRDAGVIAATADYGGPFVSALWKDNIVATQFHPEKSQAIGGIILKNFAQM